MPYTIGIDTGGTFTDVFAVEAGTGRTWTAKVPSTPADPSLAFLAGIERVRQVSGLPMGELEQLFHGTTVATNAILEGKGAVTGLLTTAGFRHVLEIGRHDAPRTESILSWVKAKRPVPPWLIREVPERLDAMGGVVRPFDEAVCRAAISSLVDAGVEAIAVCFLHAYVNDAHERRAEALIREIAPQIPVTVSSAVLRTFREYERSMVTVLDAYLLPKVGTYVSGIRKRLNEASYSGPLFIMKSGGGSATAQVAAEHPVQLAMSGLAAGAIGAVQLGIESGHRNLISIDVGGTSADVGLIVDGKVGSTSQNQIGDFPLCLPMVELTTIGAGGGSIASISEAGVLTVGPKSAGAAPGPACYGKGGVNPTVTDANLVLGRIQDTLAGGAVKLDREAARKAIEQKLAKPLGLSVEAAAAGVVEILDNMMAGAMRLVSIEKGHDPRQFAIMSFGGAGPLHSGRLAQLLHVPTIVVPPSPGVVAAYGLLVTDLKNEYIRTCIQRPPRYDLASVQAAFTDLEQQATEWLERQNVAPARRVTERHVDLRYARQGFELSVEVPAGPITEASFAELIRRFHERHRQLYTYAVEDLPVEMINVRVTGIGRMDRIEGAVLRAGSGAESAIVGSRKVWLQGASTLTDCSVYDRTKLGAGDRFSGPAIVEQADSTTLVLAGQDALVHERGSLLIKNPTT